jgi:hypothetical protein
VDHRPLLTLVFVACLLRSRAPTRTLAVLAFVFMTTRCFTW